LAKDQAAAFFDYENIYIGMQKTFGAEPDVGVLWDVISKKFSAGTPFVISKAYADWERFRGAPAILQGLAVEPVYIGAKRKLGGEQRPGVAKNAADIQLALDAQELVFTRKAIKRFVLISGDYDFVPLVLHLRKNNKDVCVVGVERDTSRELRRLAGDNYAPVEDLMGLKPLAVPRVPGIDWEALVRAVAGYERGSMPFLGRKLFTNQLPAQVLGGHYHHDRAVQCVSEAVAAGILELYYVPNPQMEGTQTAAVRLNHSNEFVKSLLEAPETP
jgi:uncharacterized LabA/DUF88 family protein